MNSIQLKSALPYSEILWVLTTNKIFFCGSIICVKALNLEVSWGSQGMGLSYTRTLFLHAYFQILWPRSVASLTVTGMGI